MVDYVDIATLQTIATGQPFAAATLQQIRDNDEFFVDPPACSAYRVSVVNVATSTPTAMAATSEFFDNDSMHSTSTNTDRITAQTAGRYEFDATVRFDPNATGSRRGAFEVNGTTIYESMQIVGVSTVRSCVITCHRKIVLAAGDYVRILVEHTAGTGLDVELYEFAATWLTR